MMSRKLTRNGLKTEHHRVRYLLSFFIPVIVMLIGFALTGVYPAGQRSALIIDGVHQYLGFYQELLNQIKSGSIFDLSSHALGYNFYALFTYYLASPFNLLILLLQCVMNLNEAVTITVLVKIGFAGSCMSWYAGKHTDKKFIPVGIGIMYALSNYILGYYSNIMWLDCVMLLPVLAYLIENLVNTGKWIAYCLVLAYCIFSNYYMGFMVCMFAGLYFVATIAAHNSWSDLKEKKRIIGITVGKFTGSSVLSAGLCGIILLPSIFSIAQTSAGKQAGVVLDGSVYGNLVEQISRLFYDSFPYATSGNQGSVNIYCGSVVLFFVILYFMDKEKGKREKAVVAILLLIYLMGFHFRFLNLVLHGFHKPVGMPNRFAFIFIFLLLRISIDSWSKAENYDRRQIITAAIVFGAICTAIGILLGNLKVMVSAGWIALMVMYLLLHCKKGWHLSTKYVRGALFALTFVEVSSHAVLSICNNGSANRNIYVNRQQEVSTLLRNTTVSSQYRSAIVNQKLRNEELLYGMNGMSLFSSTNTESVENFMKKLGCETGKNRYQYAGATEVIDMLFGIKYLIYDTKMLTSTYYQQVGTSESFTLCENTRALKNSFFVKGMNQMETLSGSNPFEVQNHLLNNLGVDSLYHMQDVTLENKGFPLKQSTTEIRLKAGEHGYLYFTGQEPNVVKVNDIAYGESTGNNNLVDLGYSKNDRILQITVDRNISYAKLGSYQEYKLDAIYQSLSEKQADLENGKATVIAAEDGMLILSQTKLDGCNILVDGKQGKVTENGGMTGVSLRKGKHVIEVSYRVPGLILGIIISFFSFMGLLKIIILTKIARRCLQ